MGQRQPPLAYLLYRLRGQREEMNTHNLVNTKANYLKTFANMVNLSCEDCRILQLRFTKKTKLQKKKPRQSPETLWRPKEVVLSICGRAVFPSSVDAFLRKAHKYLAHTQNLHKCGSLRPVLHKYVFNASVMLMNIHYSQLIAFERDFQ